MITNFLNLTIQLLFIVAFMGFQTNTFSQDVILETQANVDAFDPSTKIIEGKLVIGKFSGSTNITDLSNLSNLDSIIGYVYIKNNHDLTNLQGLNGIASVGGYLKISSNSILENVHALSSLVWVGGYFEIELNHQLKNLDGLSNVISTGGDLRIRNNLNLSNVDGLNGIISVGGHLSVADNYFLTNLDGLSNVISVGSSLSIARNDHLENCCGVHNLIENGEIGITINIYENPSECSSLQEVLDSCGGIKLTIITNKPCIGVENGSIRIYVSNYDTIPFNYQWYRQEDGITGEGISESDIIEIDMLGAGTYNITVTNAETDVAMKNDIILSEKEGYLFEVIEINTTNSSNGVNNGSITLRTSSGKAPYSYSWSGAGTGSVSNVSTDFYTIPSLSYGEYTILIEDNDGASKEVKISLLDETVQVIPCENPLDIVILNDVSGSVDATEYMESKQFFVDFLKEVNIGPDESRAAIIEWSDYDKQQLKIPITGDMSILASYIESTRAFSGNTVPHEAMKFGGSYLNDNARANAKKVMILSTDGSGSQIPSSLVSLADEFKAKGYHIISIAFDNAFSSNKTRDILRRIASVDALAPGAPAYSLLNANLAKNIVFNYLCPIDPGSSATAYFNRDGAIDITSVNPLGNCPNPEFVEVNFEISALRELSIPAGSPVTFYHNNPHQSGASPILTWMVPCVIPITTSESYTITLPIDVPSNIFAVLNDDGVNGPPINFPITEIEELSFSNNIDSERICVEDEATLQALKYSTLPIPACDTLVNYTINVCNISEADAFGVTVTDIAPDGFVLVGSIFNDNGCAAVTDGAYDIPADCCLSLSLTYDAASATNGTYNNQGVDIDGPTNQNYIDFDGSATTDEDVVIDGNIDCPSTRIEFTKAVNIDESCDDGFVEFTFTITNEMNIPIQGISFRDILPDPCTWAHTPYGEVGLSIANASVLGNEAIFTIDEVYANTVATFHMDASLNTWDSDGTLNNSATLENVPDVVNGGYTTLTSNTTSVEVTASPMITLPDTIVVESQTDSVNLEAELSTLAEVFWTTEGDGQFIDDTSESTKYLIGSQDKMDGQVSLFISAISECNETGRSVVIKIENTNSNKQKIDLVKIYPNPVRNTLFVTLSTEYQAYEILDLNGKIVDTKKNLPSRTELEINMSTYPVGVYLLQLISHDNIKYAKVVKI